MRVQPFMRAFADDLPYVVVTVQLDEQEDVQMIGRLADPALEPTSQKYTAIGIPQLTW